MRDPVFPALACAAWLLAAALAAPPLQAGLTAGTNDGVQSADPLTRMIGSFKEAVGDLAFLKADSYYHGGARHVQYRDEDGDHDHDHEEALDHEHPDSVGSEGAPMPPAAADWVSYVAGRVSPTADRHAEGSDLAELTPFLAAATRFDPHHVTAILTTAYWLDDTLGRTDEALEALEEGIRNNPASWQLDAALGQLLLEKRGDPVLASERLGVAVLKLTGADAEPFERRRAWLLLAEACERSGQNKKALAAYQQAFNYFAPGDSKTAREHIRDKISLLESRASD